LFLASHALATSNISKYKAKRLSASQVKQLADCIARLADNKGYSGKGLRFRYGFIPAAEIGDTPDYPWEHAHEKRDYIDVVVYKPDLKTGLYMEFWVNRSGKCLKFVETHDGELVRWKGQPWLENLYSGGNGAAEVIVRELKTYVFPTPLVFVPARWIPKSCAQCNTINEMYGRQ